MKIKKSVHLRVVIGIEKGQDRIRCTEDEFEDAAKFGVRDPFRKVWGIVPNEQNKQSGKNA